MTKEEGKKTSKKGSHVCMYLTVGTAVAAWVLAAALGWTAQEHSTLVRTQGRGEQLSPDFRGIPAAAEGAGAFVRSEASGLWLHRQAWEPQGGAAAARAVVVFSHGYAEHSARFLDLAKSLQAAGVAVAMQDLEGHGRSEGDKVFVPRFTRYLEDYAALLRAARAAHPGVPVVCAGQSMGSLVAALTAESAANSTSGALCDGVVLLALPAQGPMERLARRAPAVLSAVDAVARVLPRLPLVHLNDLDELTSDEAEYNDWAADPLCTRVRVRARTGAEMVHAQMTAADLAARVRVPLLVVHGENDTIALADGARAFFRDASTPAEHKQIRVYSGSRHCVLMDPKYKQTALNDITAFVLQHVAKQPVETPENKSDYVEVDSTL